MEAEEDRIEAWRVQPRPDRTRSSWPRAHPLGTRSKATHADAALRDGSEGEACDRMFIPRSPAKFRLRHQPP